MAINDLLVSKWLDTQCTIVSRYNQLDIDVSWVPGDGISVGLFTPQDYPWLIGGLKHD
jgi:hypothetical protein